MPHEDVYPFNSLPAINVIPLDFDRPPEPTRSQQKQGRSKTTDLRSMKVQEFLESSNLAANTRTSYTRQLNRFLEWTDLHWGDIKPRHISQYKAYLSHEALTTGQKKLSPSSVNSALGALHSFFKWISLAYPDLVPTNPTIGVKFHKIPETADKALDPAEMGHIWAALDQLGETKTRDTALIHLLSHGLRASEVVNLNIAGFDGNLLFLAETKNNENRVVPLNADGRAAIVLYLEERKAQGETLEPTRPLILSHHNVHGGERLTYHGIYFAVERIGRLAGLETLHPHQFRHTYATDLLRRGMDPSHARQLTGHRSDKAFKIYTRRMQQDAAISAYYRTIGEEPTL